MLTIVASSPIPERDKPKVDAIVETLIYLYTESRRLTKGLAREYGLTGPQLTVIKILEQLGDPKEVKRALVALGPWGYVAFIVSYALLQPFGAPGTVFVWAAPLIWPWPIAFALSMVGTMAASVVGFSFARFIARDWVAERIPAKFKKYDDALAQRGFVTVVTLRFVFWMPPPLHAFFGVSKVPFWTHFWGSLVGYAVPLFLVSFFGEGLFAYFVSLPASTWAGIAVVTIAIGVAYVLWRRRRLRVATQPE